MLAALFAVELALAAPPGRLNELRHQSDHGPAAPLSRSAADVASAGIRCAAGARVECGANLSACSREIARRGFSMTAPARKNNVLKLIRAVRRNDVPGDWLECGVFRGGMSALARAAQLHNGLETRRAILADSFRNFPGDAKGIDAAIAGVDNDGGSVEAVAGRLSHLGLLSDKVVFAEGYFNETLCHLEPSLGPSPLRLSILRVDGDMYLSVAQTLCCMYDHLSVGGYAIIDDWGSWPQVAAARARTRLDMPVGPHRRHLCRPTRAGEASGARVSARQRAQRDARARGACCARGHV